MEWANEFVPIYKARMHPGPSNRDVSAGGEPSSAVAPQGEAAHAGTGDETLADHEGHSQGEGASALSPFIPPTIARDDA